MEHKTKKPSLNSKIKTKDNNLENGQNKSIKSVPIMSNSIKSKNCNSITMPSWNLSHPKPNSFSYYPNYSPYHQNKGNSCYKSVFYNENY